jgi:hypothetical protein
MLQPSWLGIFVKKYLGMKNNSIATATQSDKLQNNIGYFFIGIFICALIGFHKTYTIFFPSFQGFHWQQHFHAAAIMSWITMLIVQPFLIKYEKYKTHRMLGKWGYVLAPLVFYSTFEIIKMVYYRDIAVMPENRVLAAIAIDIPDMFHFGIFYTLAMINRHQPNAHMRYMLGTALLMIPAALNRALIIFGGMSFLAGAHTCFALSGVLALLLLFYDFKKGINITPALTLVVIMVIRHICFASGNTVWWQKFAKWFVTVFF